jgi:hypothetical protein
MAKGLTRKDLAHCVEVTIAGIPMIVYLSRISYVPPDSNADNPEDCKGGWEIEFILYDIEGYRSEELDNMIYGRAEEIELRERIADMLSNQVFNNM